MKLITLLLILSLSANLYAGKKSILIGIDMSKNLTFFSTTGNEEQKVTCNIDAFNILADQFNLKKAYKLEQKYPFDDLDLFVLKFDTNDDIQNILTAYKSNPFIKGADNLHSGENINILGSRVPNDPLYSQQNAFDVMNVSNAWDISTGSKDVLVAIIDSGIDWFHPDLRNNIYINPDESYTSIDWQNGVITKVMVKIMIIMVKQMIF